RQIVREVAQLVRWKPETFSSQDLENAVVFATSAERPLYLGSRKFAANLFELVDDAILEVPDGFFGLVNKCARAMNNAFPFFEPGNEGRKPRGFEVRPDFGEEGFVNLIARRWGREGLRRSRTADGELWPNFFVPAIEGRFELFLDSSHTRLPPRMFLC